MIDSKESRLCGITHSNRENSKHWVKNQFNSSFPVALACYMRDKKIDAVYLTLNEKLEVSASEISFDEVFNTSLANENLAFNFESKFDDYQRFAHEDIRGIDLVIADTEGNQIRPLEIKLTVIPDNTTCELQERGWGAEIVIRPATTTYCALGIAHSCEEELPYIREVVEPICRDIQNWGNSHEIKAKTPEILDSIDAIQLKLLEFQKPFLMQPIWKTRGKTSFLAERAFDIFIWSDFALSRLFLDCAKTQLNSEAVRKSRKKISVSRHMRSAARLFRFLHDVSSSGKAKIGSIYTEMAFGHQTDKEFAVNGKTTRNYMNSPRIHEPAIKSSDLKNIILNGGEKKLSPERRFDQTIYFTASDP